MLTVIALGIGLQPACTEEDQIKEENTNTPIIISLAQKNGFATFTNNRHPDNRIGYRFFEHSPLIWSTVPSTVEEADLHEEREGNILAEISPRNGLVIYEHLIKENESWVNQMWTFYMAPAEDGVDMIWVIQTKESGLPLYYGVQQCFRMGGKGNATWRREIAETPAFSEYDLWNLQKDMERRTSLSWVLRNNEWQVLPAIDSCVAAQTPLGIRIDSERFPERLPSVIGPYKGILQKSIDCGLITRTDVDGEWICGIYWERTSHVTNHHPADCLHAIVNIGNVPAHSRRIIRGKIYWFKGTKDDLLNKWRKDFKEPAPDS
jgi:hypothetical protein